MVKARLAGGRRLCVLGHKDPKRRHYAKRVPIEKLSVIRLDGDTYESTRDAIEMLYPKLSPGGYCIVDDYYSFIDCERAVNEYRQENGIEDELQKIDNLAVFWQKT